ncbi:MAG TPA: hypothetical protein VFD07_09435 [Candidatus Krumholzibacteria bacterium]|nr:hypothetical protein [Candidatus Krumholzibacteria bacterium]
MSPDIPVDSNRPHTPAAGATAHRTPESKLRRDDTLQLSRRLDWRFLLADPTLRHVALLGDDDPQLVQGLRWTSSSLSLLDLGWSFAAGQEPRFDLVVLRSPRLADAQRAAALVDHDGCLYWEIERNQMARPWCAWIERLPFRFGERRAPCRPERLRAHLQGLGFSDIRVYWHRPDFHRALEIVPIENQHLLDYVLDGPSGHFVGKVKRIFGRLLLRIGLLQALVPCLSVVACKQTCEEIA